MASIIWPPELPQAPKIDNLGYTPLGNVESFEVEEGAGGDITAPRWASTGVDLTATFAMTLRQYNVFVRWWRDDAKGGAVPFAMKDPMDGAWYDWMLRPGEKSHDVKFVSADGRFVTLPLRRLP